MQGGLVALGSLGARVRGAEVSSVSRSGEILPVHPWKCQAGQHQCEQKYGPTGASSTSSTSDEGRKRLQGGNLLSQRGRHA